MDKNVREQWKIWSKYKGESSDWNSWKQWLNDLSFKLNERKKCLKYSPPATPNNDVLNALKTICIFLW